MVKDEDKLSKETIGASMEVHRNLGPGLLESAYEECLCREQAILINFNVPILKNGIKRIVNGL